MGIACPDQRDLRGMKAGSGPSQYRSLRLNLGCGQVPRSGFLNLDRRNLPGSVDIQAEACRLPFPDGSIEEVLAESVFEHLADPRPAIAESARVLSPSGTLVVRVPALGTCAAHLDPTHRYLADLKHWTDLLQECFESVRVDSVGVRWRASRSLVLVQRLCISVLGWHDLAQCWILTASRPRSNALAIAPPRWWLDE